MEAKNEKYRALFESLDDGYCVVKIEFDEADNPLDYQLLEKNTAFESIAAAPATEGERMRLFSPELDGQWLGKYSKVALTGEPLRFENHAKELGRWYNVYAFPFGEPEDREVALLFNDITGRKQSEQELRELQIASQRQKRLYETVLYNTPDLVCVIDLDHRFLFVNEALQKAWGISEGEAIGKSFSELGYEPWQAEQHNQEIDQVVKTKEPVRGEMPFHHTIHGERIYDYIFVPVLNDEGGVEAIAGTTRDITERKRVEERDKFLVQLSSALHSIEDPEECMSVTTKLLGTYLEADRCVYSEVAEDENTFIIRGDYSCSEKEEISEDITVSSFGEEACRLMHANRAFVVDDVQQDGRIQNKEKGVYEMFKIRAFISIPLHKEGRLVTVLAVHEDQPRKWENREVELVKQVTNRCWETLERGRVTKDLQKINETLEERVQKRTESLLSYQRQLRTLASRLSQAEAKERHRLAAELHDNLGQMLAVGKMKAGLLQKDHLPERAVQEVGELKQLLEEALVYTRELMSDLKPPPSLDKEDVRASIHWLAQKMEKHGLQVTVTDDGQLKRVSDDIRIPLIQCVRELLFNVLKHAGVDEAAIEMTTMDKQVQILVVDKGDGFNPDNNSKSSSEGGFGLFNVKERMDLLGGAMKIKSEPGNGTKAFLRAPLQNGSQVKKNSGGDGDETNSQPVEKSKYITVLLVDDHKIMREGLRRIVDEQEDMKVVAEASDGQEAVYLAKEYTPQIIVMDINMPVLNGIDATKEIIDQRPDQRIIGLSLHNHKNVAESMRNAGASAYLTKNEAFETLCATIRSEAGNTHE